MNKPRHDTLTDFKKGSFAEELVNPSNISEETNPNDNDNKSKFVPIDEVIDPDNLDIENQTDEDEELEIEDVDTNLEFDLEKARVNFTKLKNENAIEVAQAIINDQRKIIKLEKNIQAMREKQGSDKKLEYLPIKDKTEEEEAQILKKFNDYLALASERIGAVDKDFIYRNVYKDFANKIFQGSKGNRYKTNKSNEDQLKEKVA